MRSEGPETDDRVDILLVEPSAGDARLFAEAFDDAQLANRVAVVHDGEEALDYLHQRGEHAGEPRPDFVLLEPKLPRTDGIELLRELKGDDVLADIPVVVLASSETGEEIVREYDVEADHYIQKPVEPEDFIECVNEVEEFWLAILEEPTSN